MFKFRSLPLIRSISSGLSQNLNKPASFAVLTLGAILATTAPAHAGRWKLSLEVDGQSSWKNTVNPAWHALGQPNGDGKAGRVPWTAFTESNNAVRVTDGLFIVQGPTDRAWWYGGLGPEFTQTWGVPATTVNATASLVGSITPVVEWEADDENDLPPTEVHILEQSDVSTAVENQTTSHPYDTINQIVDNGMADAFTLTSGGVDFPWKKVEGIRTRVMQNLERKTKLKFSTVHLKAESVGSVTNQPVRAHAHSVGMYYRASLPGVNGTMRLVMLKEKANGKLQTLNSLTSPTFGKVGGRIWVGAEFMVHDGAKLDSELKSLTLRLLENVDESLPVEDRHQHEVDDCLDVKLNLAPNSAAPPVTVVTPVSLPANGIPPTAPLEPATKPMRWEKNTNWSPFGTSDDDWETTNESFDTPNTTGSPVLYRVAWAWDSFETLKNTTTLYDHNGPHTLSLEKIEGAKMISFLGADVHSTGISQTDPEKVAPVSSDVQNLVLENVSAFHPNRQNGNPDYFLYDGDESAPEWMQKPKISFTVKDSGKGNDNCIYKWKIRIRPTEEQLKDKVMFYEGSVSQPGICRISLADIEPTGEGEPEFKGSGPYNYEIKVWKEFASGLKDAGVTYRSIYTYIPDEFGGVEGHSSKVVDETSHFNVLMNYVISNTHDSRPMKFIKVYSVSLFDGKLVDLKENLPKTSNVMNNDVAVCKFYSMTGPYDAFACILAGEDKLGFLYRDHKDRPLLPKNQSWQPHRFNMWYSDAPPGWVSEATQVGLVAADIDYAHSYVRREMLRYGLHTYWHSGFGTNLASAHTGANALNAGQKDQNFNLPYKLSGNLPNGQRFYRARTAKKVIIAHFFTDGNRQLIEPAGESHFHGMSNNDPAEILLKKVVLGEGVGKDSVGGDGYSLASKTLNMWIDFDVPDNPSFYGQYRKSLSTNGRREILSVRQLNRNSKAIENTFQLSRPTSASMLAQFYGNALMHEMWHIGSEQLPTVHCGAGLPYCLASPQATQSFAYDLSTSPNVVEFDVAYGHGTFGATLPIRLENSPSVLHEGGDPLGRRSEISQLQWYMKYWKKGHQQNTTERQY